MTPNKEKALAALLTQPTQEMAAAEAGIDPRTLRRYLADPEFQEEYKKAFSGLVTEATRQAQQSLSAALSTLREILEDSSQAATARIQASRSLLESDCGSQRLRTFCETWKLQRVSKCTTIT